MTGSFENMPLLIGIALASVVGLFFRKKGDKTTFEKKIALKNSAYHDALTSLYNRRYCFVQLKKCLKMQESSAVGLIDLHRLKYVNDQFGHLTGDEFIIMGVKLNGQTLLTAPTEIAFQFSEQTKQYEGSLNFGIKEIGKNNIFCDKEVLKLLMK